MLSTHSGEEDIYRALQAGAYGYVLKNMVREELLRAIRQVVEGQRYLDPAVASVLAGRVGRRTLTSRELKFFAWSPRNGQQRDWGRFEYRRSDSETARQPRARQTQRERSYRGRNRCPATRNYLAGIIFALPI
jgi:DNA-binding response OmpR family regulator